MSRSFPVRIAPLKLTGTIRAVTRKDAEPRDSSRGSASVSTSRGYQSLSERFLSMIAAMMIKNARRRSP